jgi:restriction system protein
LGVENPALPRVAYRTNPGVAAFEAGACPPPPRPRARHEFVYAAIAWPRPAHNGPVARRYPRRQPPLDEEVYRAFVVLPTWVPPLVAVAALLGIGLGVPALLHTTRSTAWWELGLFAALGILVAGFSALIERRRRTQRLASTRRLADLRAMSWTDFEMLVEDAYRRQGWQTDRTGGHGADGGVDILLRRNGAVTAVQCKKWTTQVVGVGPVRERLGALPDHGAATGIFVTAGRFTPEAIAYAERRGLELVDGPALLALIADGHIPGATPDPAPPQLSTPGSPCPRCSGELVMRVNKATRAPFLGCSRFPQCRETRAL